MESPPVKGPKTSAFSSRLKLNVSSPSRRLRHVSPPPVSRYTAQKADLSTYQSPARLTFSRVFHFPLLYEETHRVTSTRGRVVRGMFSGWAWFCLLYFSAAVFQTLRRAAIGLHDSSPTEALIDFPEHILATLPLDHRLSKLSSLPALEDTLHPFALGPRLYADNITTACLWAQESDLSQLQDWVSSWSGPISLLVTTSTTPGSSPHKQLLSKLTSFSQMAPNVTFHVLSAQTSLRNFNAYANLARLYSPSSKVLLFPPFSMSTRAPLPRASVTILEATPMDQEFIIPMLTTATPNSPSVDLSLNDILPSSALLLSQHDSPWCTERLFTIAHDMKSTGDWGLSMEYHWQECVWNIWLRSTGRIQLLDSDGWATFDAREVPSLKPLPETAETRLSVRTARKQRSETCVLVARELIALGQWYKPEPLPSLNGGGVVDVEGPVSTAVSGSRVRRTIKESERARWLRSVCKETLDKWGKEILD